MAWWIWLQHVDLCIVIGIKSSLPSFTKYEPHVKQLLQFPAWGWGEAMSIHGLLMGQQVVLITKEKFPVDTAQDGKHWVKWLHCSGCLHEIPLCLVVSAECSNHALPCPSLFKHKSTWKADFLFHRLSRFLLSDEEPGQNNNCWAETIQCSFDLHVIFKSALQAHSVDDKVLIKCLQGQISPISRILQNESKVQVFLWEWDRESIYNKHILTY